MPTRRPDDDYDDEPRRDDPDDPPRRRRRDDDEPRRRDDRPAKKSGAGRLLLILLLGSVGLVVVCCGGCAGLLYYFSGRQVTMVDGSRTRNPQGGTSSVQVRVMIGGDSPGGFFRGDFVFKFQSGSRTSVHPRGLMAIGGRGQGGPAEYRETFLTPELANETGPVTFWVERHDGGSVHKVSPTYTIP